MDRRLLNSIVSQQPDPGARQYLPMQEVPSGVNRRGVWQLLQDQQIALDTILEID